MKSPLLRRSFPLSRGTTRAFKVDEAKAAETWKRAAHRSAIAPACRSIAVLIKVRNSSEVKGICVGMFWFSLQATKTKCLNGLEHLAFLQYPLSRDAVKQRAYKEYGRRRVSMTCETHSKAGLGATSTLRIWTRRP